MKKVSQRIRAYLPPGFRTRCPWKMILAVIGYVLIGWVGLTMKMNDAGGIPVTGALLAASRIVCIAISVAVIFFWADYGGMHQIMPLMKNRRWKAAGYCLYPVLIVLAAVLILYLFGV